MQTPQQPRRPLLTQIAHRHLRQAVQEWQARHPAGTPKLAIDATAGNGHDTVFLAELLGADSEVAVFDIQPQALTNTAARLRRHAANFTSAAATDAENPVACPAPLEVAQMQTASCKTAQVQVACSTAATADAAATGNKSGGDTLAKVRLIEASHADMLTCLPECWRGAVCAITFNLGYLPGGDKTCVTRAQSTVTALESALQLLAPGGLLSVLCYRGHAEGGSETDAIRHWLATLSAAYNRNWIDAGAHAPAHAPLLLHIRRKQ